MLAAQSPKPILYLFLGAGASVPANVPATEAFLVEFRKSIADDPNLASALSKIEAALERAAIYGGAPSLDIESVLGAISFLRNRSDVGHAFLMLEEPILGIEPETLDLLNLRIHEFIRKVCLVLPKATESLSGIERLLRDYREIHAFTVNYDVVFEQLVGRFGVRPIDGFRWKWDPETFKADAPAPKVCVYKLHGSAIWYRSSNEAYVELPIRGETGQFELLGGDPAIPLIMYPGRKWEYTRPYLFLLDRFGQLLHDADWLVTVGYRFRDEHLNRVLWEAAIDNPDLRMILISPEAERVYNETLKASEFGWTVESGDRTDKGAVSPLLYRVVRLPFKWERVIADFGSNLLADVKQGVAQFSNALAAMTYPGPVNWDPVAMGLVKAHFVDPLEEVETRFSPERAEERWKIEYFGRKAIVQSSLGHRRDAEASWSKLVSIVRDWKATLDVSITDRPPANFTLGFIRPDIRPGQPPTNTRVGPSYAPYLLEPVIDLARKHSFYMDGSPDSEGAVHIAECLGKLVDYVSEFGSSGGEINRLDDYLFRREKEFPSEVARAQELLKLFALQHSEGKVEPTGESVLAPLTAIIKKIEQTRFDQAVLAGLEPLFRTNNHSLSA